MAMRKAFTISLSSPRNFYVGDEIILDNEKYLVSKIRKVEWISMSIVIVSGRALRMEEDAE